jgi:hypothetical protein
VVLRVDIVGRTLVSISLFGLGCWVGGDLDAEVATDAGRMTTQLGTPRGRYDEYSSKFSLSKKPRFVSPRKSQTPEGDAC